MVVVAERAASAEIVDLWSEVDMGTGRDVRDLLALEGGELQLRAAIQAADEAARNAEPAFERYSLGELRELFPSLAPPVIDGLVRHGETLNLISDTKIGKSWLGYGMGVSIATGWPWLKTFDVSQGRALLVDNELHPATIVDRIANHVAPAMGIEFEEIQDQIHVWPLRGRMQTIDELSKAFDEVEEGEYELIVFDALYRFLCESVTENDNSQMARFYNAVDQIGLKTGAAIVLIHHTSKGSQADKRVVDVGSGAGSQSRAADAHVILRPHEQPGVCILEAAVRSFPPPRPVPLFWKFPCWWLAEGVDTAQLKGKQSRREQRDSERIREAVDRTLEALLDGGPATARELRRRTGFGASRQERAIDLLCADRQIEVGETVINNRTYEQFRLKES